MLKWNRPISPRIFKKVEGNKAKVGVCVAMWSGGGKFQVSAGGHAQYIVDLEVRSCSCRAWDLQGWPCVHAIAAINYTGGLDVMEFVDDYYLTTTYFKTYRNVPPKAKLATKRKRGTENTQTTIDPSQVATSVGPSTIKKRSKPPRRVQKGKPLVTNFSL
ncbi:hypothetical protein ACE6H2_015370 [Prunus campanulata]